MAVRQQIVGRVLVVTLDEPATRNALDTKTMAALHGVFASLVERSPLLPEVRPHVVVLRATGKVFSAGAHLGEMKSAGRADRQTNVKAAGAMGAMFRAVRDCPVPVVARVQGAAYGGGAGLAAACDLVVAGAGASFCFSEVRLGLVPGVISPLVVGRVGLARARDLFLTARTIGADEALRLGLADRAVPVAGTDGDEGLDAAVAAVVDDLLCGGPAALGSTKFLLEGVAAQGYHDSGDFCAEQIATARTSPEAQAALGAFEKRQPPYWKPEAGWRLPPEDEGTLL